MAVGDLNYDGVPEIVYPTERNTLRRRSHSVAPRRKRLERPHDAFRAEAVTVGLHHRQQTGTAPDAVPHCPVICAQRIEVDLDPRARHGID